MKELLVVASWHSCDNYVSYIFMVSILAALLYIYFVSPVDIYITLK
jgi:hypothetical protein